MSTGRFEEDAEPDEESADTVAERHSALRELEQFLSDLWNRPMPEGIIIPRKRWTRAELYEDR